MVRLAAALVLATSLLFAGPALAQQGKDKHGIQIKVKVKGKVKVKVGGGHHHGDGHSDDNRGHQGNQGKDQPPGGVVPPHRAPPAPAQPQPPRLDRFAPESGPPGATVQLLGGEFDANTQVRFNGQWIAVVQRTPTTLTVQIPTSGVTDRFVVAKTGFAELAASKPFVVLRPPVISSFSPAAGSPGTQVTILGQQLLPVDRFAIGTLEVPVLNRFPDRVIVRIPEGAATQRFGVKRGGTVLAWSNATFEVLPPPPVIDSFLPIQGGPGTVVRLTGRYFEPSDYVEHSGHRLRIQGRGPTFIDVVIGPFGSGQFVLKGRMNRQALSANSFRLLLPPMLRGFQPNFGPPGTRITVDGQNFVEGDRVFVGSAMLTIRTVAPQQIVAELPAGVASGLVHLERAGHHFPPGGRFEVVFAPRITDVSPRSAPPGSTVSIRGQNFLPEASVLLNGQSLPIIRRQATVELAATIPPTARSGQLVVVTRGGSAPAPFVFTVNPYAVLSSFFPLHSLPSTRVTLRGAYFHPGMRVLLNGLALPIISLAPNLAIVEIPQGARSGRFYLESYGRSAASNMDFTVDEPLPEVAFTFTPQSGAPGSEVTLLLTPPQPRGVMVYFEGRPLPKKVLEGGRHLVVTIPADSHTAYFELELNGKRYRAPQAFQVR